MSLIKPTIILFDMDGTTVRHIHPRLLSFLERVDDLLFQTTSWLRRKQSSVFPLPEQIRKKRSLPFHRILHKIRYKPLEEIVEPCPGIHALLHLIRNADIPTGVVSNGLGKGYGHDVLDKFGLSSLFTAKIFREDIDRSKPAPDSILRALSLIKTPLMREDVIWYIGDRRKDILAALEASKVLPTRIIPFAYGINATLALFERGFGIENVILNYTDFAEKIRPCLHSSPVSSGSP